MKILNFRLTRHEPPLHIKCILLVFAVGLVRIVLQYRETFNELLVIRNIAPPKPSYANIGFDREENEHIEGNNKLKSVKAAQTDTSPYKNQVVKSEQIVRGVGLKFSNSFGHHMVLQQAPQSAILWGFSDVLGDAISVQLNDDIVANTKTLSDPSKAVSRAFWKVKLPPQSNHGPFNITAISRDQKVTLRDVMFGDVWMCSGQSNMEFGMEKVWNASAEIEDSLRYPTIRILFTKSIAANNSKLEVDVKHSWLKPTKGVVEKFSAVCFMFARDLQRKLNYPIGLIQSTWGGTDIQVWSSQDAIKSCPSTEIRSLKLAKNEIPHHRSVLWNSMVYPYLQTTIKGVIWYQGEKNRHISPENYACFFPAMIEDWRLKFNDGSQGETSRTFPFGFVQLAGFRDDDSITKGFPDIRWYQTAGFGFAPNPKMPNTFMAVAADLPDFSSLYKIHPRHKREIAERLSLGAQNMAYGDKSVVFQAPFPTQFVLHKRSKRLNITFTDGKARLQVNDVQKFEVCCTSIKCNINSTSWYPAPMIGHEMSTITLDVSLCEARNQVGAIRYLWRESPCALLKCPLYGRMNNLPVPPFIQMGPFKTM